MRKLNFIALLGITLMAFSLFATVVADEYDNQLLTVAPNKNIWKVTALNPEFDVNDVNVDSVEASYTVGSSTTVVEPKKVLVIGGELVLIFKASDLPDSADIATVTGTVGETDTFSATTSGFAWARR